MLILGDSAGDVHHCEVQISGAKIKTSMKKVKFKYDTLSDDALFLMVGREATSVSSIQFDPHSESYCLIALANGKILLFDVKSWSVIQIYQKLNDGP